MKKPRPVPEADPAAVAHMQYELDNRERAGLLSRVIGPFSSHPDVRVAAKSGSPAMDPRRPTIPISVPQTAAGAGVTDVNAAVVTDTSALDKNPDARANPPGQSPAPGTAEGAAATDSSASQPQVAPPTNHPLPKKKKAKKNPQPAAAPASSSTTPPAATDATKQQQ